VVRKFLLAALISWSELASSALYTIEPDDYVANAQIIFPGVVLETHQATSTSSTSTALNSEPTLLQPVSVASAASMVGRHLLPDSTLQYRTLLSTWLTTMRGSGVIPLLCWPTTVTIT
jgi:hypothetical protein